jgi:hypothetical protein
MFLNKPVTKEVPYWLLRETTSSKHATIVYIDVLNFPMEIHW